MSNFQVAYFKNEKICNRNIPSEVNVLNLYLKDITHIHSSKEMYRKILFFENRNIEIS